MASGSATEAIVEVAALNRATPLSDAEPLVRAMLIEQGIDIPLADDEESDYQVLLLAFGHWNLSIHFFEGPFYVRIPAWEDQSPLDRTLVTLMDQRDQLTTPTERDAVEQEMRAVVRAHVRAG